MNLFRKLNLQTADIKLRLIPELRPLPREQRWSQWIDCYDVVAGDRRVRSLRTVRAVCPIMGILAGAALGFLVAGVVGGMIGFVAGALMGGAVGGLIHGMAFRRRARFLLRDT